MTEHLLGFAVHVLTKVVEMLSTYYIESEWFSMSPATEYLSFTNYWSRKFVLHAWKDPLIFSELAHYLFIAPYDRIQRRTKAINLKAAMTVEEIWSDSQQPTFYAKHAVSLGWFSFTATKNLPRQLHFQVKLCKIQAFDNTQVTKTQPCSKWRRLDWTFSDVINSSQSYFPAKRFWLRWRVQRKRKISRIRTSNQIISSAIWNK